MYSILNQSYLIIQHFNQLISHTCLSFHSTMFKIRRAIFPFSKTSLLSQRVSMLAYGTRPYIIYHNQPTFVFHLNISFYNFNNFWKHTVYKHANQL